MKLYIKKLQIRITDETAIIVPTETAAVQIGLMYYYQGGQISMEN